jgi:hypothetical protein
MGQREQMVAILVLSSRKMVIGRQQLGCHLLLRRQVFTAVCCAAASSEDHLF